MAAEIEALYRAAVQASAPELDELAQVALARTLARLVPVLARRPGGAVQVTLEYTPGHAQPRIRPWGALWGELD